MKISRVLLTVTFICFATFGCKDRAGGLGVATKDAQELEAADVAKALGMSYWQVKLPTDLKQSDLLGVTYKHSDGTIDGMGGSTGWEAGSVVKVMVWPADDSAGFRYSVIHARNAMRGELRENEEYKGISMQLSEGKVVDAEDVLMKFSKSSCIAVPTEVRPGELGVILHVDKKDGDDS